MPNSETYGYDKKRRALEEARQQPRYTVYNASGNMGARGNKNDSKNSSDIMPQDHSRNLQVARARQENDSSDNNADNNGRPEVSEIFKNASGKSNGVSGAINTAKSLSKATTPLGIFSLLKHANLLKDMPFVCAAGFAILKDILDLVFNETIILGILFSILCSIFIFMMLILAGSNGKKKIASGLIKKGGVIIGGGVVDFLPAIGFSPVETMTVGVVYMLVLVDRANAEK